MGRGLLWKRTPVGIKGKAIKMSKKPEKPKTERPPGPAVPDYLLEPVPVPDVVESDSDTAWGMWQDSVQSAENPETRPGGDSVFQPTVPADLSTTPPVKRRREY